MNLNIQFPVFGMGRSNPHILETAKDSPINILKTVCKIDWGI